MREIAVKVWDDLDWHDHGTKTEAAGTVLIGLDGSWRELDLSAANLNEVRMLLERYLTAGHKPAADTVPAPAALHGPSGRHISPESRAYGTAIREFADTNGLSYRTESGSYYYSKRLREAFARYLAETEPESPMAVFARTSPSWVAQGSKTPPKKEAD